MNKELQVSFGMAFNGEPLVTVHNLPGGDAAFTPAQLRALGAALIVAAEDCEKQPVDKRRSCQVERTYQLTECATASITLRPTDIKAIAGEIVKQMRAQERKDDSLQFQLSKGIEEFKKQCRREAMSEDGRRNRKKK